MPVRAVVFVTGVSLVFGPTVATARPLPPTGLKVAKGITGWVDVVNVPGVGVSAVPGGDLAIGYDCQTTQSVEAASTVCVQDAGSDYVFSCSNVEVGQPGFSFPGVRATASCEGSRGGAHVATYDSDDLGPSNRIVFAPETADRAYCSASGPASSPFAVRCSFALLSYQSIEGGVLMSQAKIAGQIVVTTYGVLGDDQLWKCLLETDPLLPPTVVCSRVNKDLDWYCGFARITAIATGPLPSVRGQLSCDGTMSPVPPGRTGDSLSTGTVPTPAGAPEEVRGEWLMRDTEVFICQAWGPLDGPVPVAPWTVDCYDP